MSDRVEGDRTNVPVDRDRELEELRALRDTLRAERDALLAEVETAELAADD